MIERSSEAWASLQTGWRICGRRGSCVPGRTASGRRPPAGSASTPWSATCSPETGAPHRRPGQRAAMSCAHTAGSWGRGFAVIDLMESFSRTRPCGRFAGGGFSLSTRWGHCRGPGRVLSRRGPGSGRTSPACFRDPGLASGAGFLPFGPRRRFVYVIVCSPFRDAYGPCDTGLQEIEGKSLRMFSDPGGGQAKRIRKRTRRRVRGPNSVSV